MFNIHNSSRNDCYYYNICTRCFCIFPRRPRLRDTQEQMTRNNESGSSSRIYLLPSMCNTETMFRLRSCFYTQRTDQEWNAIAHDFLRDSRTGTQCATHWKMVLKPALLKGVWSPEEDTVIYDCVARGVTDWSEVASALPKRKAKHCRERWNNHLDPALSKAEWTYAEESKLLKAVEAHGTSWTHIARLLPGRSEAMVQQHWNSIVFRDAMSAGSLRRGRSRTDSSTAAGNSSSSNRNRAKPSALPSEAMPPPRRPGHDLITREEGIVGSGAGAGSAIMGADAGAATLTEREKALMDHAFKTGLNAAAGGGTGAGGGVGVSSPEIIDQVSKGGGGVERLTLSAEEEDIFAPLSAALLKGQGSDGCSPDMPPPSPTASPLKPHQHQPDYDAVGHQLADGWGADDDPALADLYRSLDNIGESLFNEDNFELSFDFDSVDKRAPPACSSSSSNTKATAPACSASQANSPSCNWDNMLSGGHEPQKEVSPFRRAAAQASATLEKQRHSMSNYEHQKQGHGLQAACARAAVAAASAAAHGSSAATSSATSQPEGPRVKQGFLRRLLPTDSKPGKQQHSRVPFATIRGCLSEANAPPPPPPLPAAASSGTPMAGAVGSSGGENRAPRRGQPLSVALFGQPSALAGGDSKGIAEPTLKHGKAEVKVPPPPQHKQQVLGQGVLSARPASRFNAHQQGSDSGWAGGRDESE